MGFNNNIQNQNKPDTAKGMFNYDPYAEVLGGIDFNSLLNKYTQQQQPQVQASAPQQQQQTPQLPQQVQGKGYFAGKTFKPMGTGRII